MFDARHGIERSNKRGAYSSSGAYNKGVAQLHMTPLGHGASRSIIKWKEN
jgi:hypothetical protein